MAKEFAKKLYNSKAWKDTREAILVRDKGLCQTEGCHAPAEEVHHITELSPFNIDDPKITLNPKNLISLCKDCHMKIHREKALKIYQDRQTRRILKGGYYFDTNGIPRPMQVDIVWGSPASGKSTYVETHRRQGDLVLDLDRIQWALGQTEGMNNLVSLSILVRDYLYKLIEERAEEIDCKHVWIVAGLPKKKDREELSNRLKANLIHIDADIDTCTERARKRNNSQIQIAIVERYFEELQT